MPEHQQFQESYTDPTERKRKIRQEKREKRLARDKKIRRIFLIVAPTLAILAALYALFYYVTIISVKNVEVEGQEHLAQDTMASIATQVEGANMLRVDTQVLAQEYASQPWVDQVTVTKKWPQTLSVRILEHKPIAKITTNGDTVLIDDQGRAFLRGESVPDAVELLSVTEKDKEKLEAARTVIPLLEPGTRQEIQSISIDSVDNIVLNFPEKTVQWGSVERAVEKARATEVVRTRNGREWTVVNPAMPAVKVDSLDPQGEPEESGEL